MRGPLSCYGAVADQLVRPLTRKDDTEDAAKAKRIVVSVMMLAFPATIVFAVTDPGASVMYTAGAWAGLVTGLVTYAGWAVFPRAPMEVFFLCGTLLAVLCGDVYAMARSDRMWSLGVLVMDGALVLNIQTTHTVKMLAATVAYLVIASGDRAVTGFYRDASPSVRSWACDCADPPCLQPAESALTDLWLVLGVFLCDFYLTRDFATLMRRQNSMMQAAITVTEAIAQQLSQYEVEEGRELLLGARGDQLPLGLRNALHRLLDNLNEYRPYLPDAMLVRESTAEIVQAEPPGLGRDLPTVSMCFTDIQSSTELWEGHPQGMHSALQTHNDVIRRCAGSTGGYEVKVIGDSFMLAFRTAEDACLFGVTVQLSLVTAKWPSDLLHHPLCAPVARPGSLVMLWSGPRVRIGMNSGPVRVDKNPVTGRCDYFGPTVNVAARVETCLQHGGLTGLTEAVLSAVPETFVASLGAVVTCLGEKDLKGVAEPVKVMLIFDRRLAGREAVLHEPPIVRRVSRRQQTESSESAATDCSSVMSWSCSSFPARRHTEPRIPSSRSLLLREGMSRRAATSAAFRARPGADLVALGNSTADMLELVEYAADATQGVVAAAVSAQCVVVWNGPRICGDHYEQGLRALSVVRHSRGKGVAAGACSGEVLYGMVAAGRKKHAAVIGGCVELSMSLAEAAEEGGEAALVAGTFGVYCSTMLRTRRHADWRAKGAPPFPVLALTADSDAPWERRADATVVCLDSFVEHVRAESSKSGASGCESNGRSVARPDRQVLLGHGVQLRELERSS